MGERRRLSCPRLPPQQQCTVALNLEPSHTRGPSSSLLTAPRTLLPRSPGTSPAQVSPSAPSQTTKPVPQQCPTLHALAAQHKELPASELSLVCRSPPLTPATLTSSLFASWGNIHTSPLQQVTAPCKICGTGSSHSWGLPALGTSLAAGGKCAPLHSGVLPGGRRRAWRGDQPGWGLPADHSKPCLVGSRAETPAWQQWLLESLFETVFYASLT